MADTNSPNSSASLPCIRVCRLLTDTYFKPLDNAAGQKTPYLINPTSRRIVSSSSYLHDVSLKYALEVIGVQNNLLIAPEARHLPNLQPALSSTFICMRLIIL